MTTRILVAVLIPAIFLSLPAVAEETGDAQRPQTCLRVDAAEAVTAALARGDRAAAVDLLERAEAQLEACAPGLEREAANPERNATESDVAVIGRSVVDRLG